MTLPAEPTRRRGDAAITFLLAVVLSSATTACGAAAKAPPGAIGPEAHPARAMGQAAPAPGAAEARDEPEPAFSATSPGPPAKADAAEEVARDPALVIYEARFVMAVYQVDQGLAAVEKVARDNGGFLAKKQDREIVVRVPRARFQHVLAGIDLLGDVLHRDVAATDVTEEHVDLEIRIKNARAMQGRLKELLARANVKEALEIEKELHRVTGELELLEGKLKVLRDRIAYSTVTVAFEPRVATIETPSARLPFPWLSELGLPSLLSLSEDK